MSTETISHDPLKAYAKDVASQGGEDGIIARIFEIIGTANKYCLELGALNGTHDSNTWNLITNEGWNALLLEADVTQFAKLQALYKDNTKVQAVNVFVSFEGETSLDVLCANANLPKDFDLLSLDIDGNDYHVWESMTQFTPRVVVIEFNQAIPNSISFIQPRDMNVFQGSSLKAVTELAKKKGYELVTTTESNGFFVRKELFEKFGITDNSLDALHTDTSFQTQIFQLYDGTLKIEGCKELIWHHLPITEEAIQVLPKAKRKYSAHIDASDTVRVLKYHIRRLPGYALAQKIRKSL